jgi:hypothetical protein
MISFSPRNCNSIYIDPRLVFLQRASVRLYLVEADEMTLDEAFEDLLDGLQCTCSREIVERWERDYPPVSRRKFSGRAA